MTAGPTLILDLAAFRDNVRDARRDWSRPPAA